MKTEREKGSYPIPADMGQLLWAAIDETETYGVRTPMIYHGPTAFRLRIKGKENVLGRPTDFTIANGEFHLWPVPDQAYNFIGDYLGHRRSF